LKIVVVAAIYQSKHANPETRAKAPPAKRDRGLGDENNVLQVASFFWTFTRLRTIRENANYFQKRFKITILAVRVHCGRWIEQSPPICVFENKLGHIFPLTDGKCEKFFGMKHVHVYFEFDLKL